MFDALEIPEAIERGAFDDLLVNLETACRNRRSELEAAGEKIDWEDEPGGITREAQADGHRYVMGNVNAHCPRCATLHYEQTGEHITVLSCRYDTDA